MSVRFLIFFQVFTPFHTSLLSNILLFRAMPSTVLVGLYSVGGFRHFCPRMDVATLVSSPLSKINCISFVS